MYYLLSVCGLNPGPVSRRMQPDTLQIQLCQFDMFDMHFPTEGRKIAVQFAGTNHLIFVQIREGGGGN